MAKRDYLKEARDGFDKWVRITCILLVFRIFLDILPHLPTELGNRIVNALLRKLGI